MILMEHMCNHLHVVLLDIYTYNKHLAGHVCDIAEEMREFTKLTEVCFISQRNLSSRGRLYFKMSNCISSGQTFFQAVKLYFKMSNCI